jgi:hypothetical protein
MSIPLQRPIDLYLKTENSGDVDALSECFVSNATVRDEGHTYQGLAAIRRWKADTKKKYQNTVEPLASAHKDGKTIVTNRLTGNFPGGPIDIQFIFGLDGDKIVSLEIHS